MIERADIPQPQAAPDFSGGRPGAAPRRHRSATAKASEADTARAIATLQAAGFSILVAGSRVVRWLTVADVAARLSVSPITVRRMVERGELAPVLRWSTEIRVSERGLASWEARHTQAGRVEHQQREGGLA